MGDVRTLYEPDDEVEALGIEGLLAQEGIACRIRRGADTAYPGIADQPGGWGEILVAEEDLERAQLLVAEYLEAEAEAVEPELGPYRDTRDPGAEAEQRAASTALERSTKRGVRRLFLLLLLAGSLLLNAKFLLQDRFDSLPAGEVETYDDTGRLLSVHRYQERAAHPYEAEQYDADGRLMWSGFDPDADGWIDRTVVHHDDSSQTEFRDEDGDGFFESGRTVRDGEVLYRLFDADGDQLYERMRSETVELVDLDSDGMYDEAICQTPDGETRTLDIASCAAR